MDTCKDPPTISWCSYREWILPQSLSQLPGKVQPDEVTIRWWCFYPVTTELELFKSDSPENLCSNVIQSDGLVMSSLVPKSISHDDFVFKTANHWYTRGPKTLAGRCEASTSWGWSRGRHGCKFVYILEVHWDIQVWDYIFLFRAVS